MKRITRIVSVLTAVVIFAVSAVFPASAEMREEGYVSIDESTAGLYGAFLTTIDRNGIDYYDFENGMVGVDGYIGKKTDLTIPKTLPWHDDKEYTVASIKHGAFSGDKYLNSITLPDTILEIHSSAFSRMKSIKRIYVPSSVKLIDDNAFEAMPQDFKLVVEKGSLAERYAKENDINYIYYEDDDYDRTTRTYYFLAPDEWFKSEYGAATDTVCCLCDAFEEKYGYLGAEMTYMRDFGENVFRVTGVPASVTQLTFNDGCDYDAEGGTRINRTAVIDLGGYDGNCPYDEQFTTSDFDGMIYVLNCDLGDSRYDRGAWFDFYYYTAVKGYREYDDYYGSYSFVKGKPTTYTYYFLAPDDWFDTDKGAANDKVCCFQSKPAKHQGLLGSEMTPAPEIGKNVYKITDVPTEIKGLRFNDGFYLDLSEDTDNEFIPKNAGANSNYYDRINIKCPYDSKLTVRNFNNWIYVLKLKSSAIEVFDYMINYDQGAWFPLDEYRYYDDYYGTYNIDETIDTSDEPKKATGNIYFNAEKWQSEAVEFYIFDKNTGEVASPDGWEDRELWGSRRLCGTRSADKNHVFESFEFTLSDKRDAYVIFFDPDTGYQLAEMKLDLDSFGKCAAPSGELTGDGNETAVWVNDFDYKTPGDLDGDRQITSADALAILRISAGAEDDDLILGDIDGDGQVTSADALEVLRMSVGMISTDQ